LPGGGHFVKLKYLLEKECIADFHKQRINKNRNNLKMDSAMQNNNKIKVNKKANQKQNKNGHKNSQSILSSARRFSDLELAYFMKSFKLTGSLSVRPIEVIYGNGDTYRGEFDKNGLKCGYGFMFYKNGDILQARWKDDLANGSGYYQSASGTEMIGMWSNGQFHGNNNVIRFPSGSVYKGQVMYGAMNGKGQKTDPDGDIYYGDWVNNLCHGEMNIKYSNGEIYMGFMENNTKCGPGTYSWPNGMFYKGYWHDDSFHGEGYMDTVQVYGKVYYGNWDHGQQLDMGWCGYTCPGITKLLY
jgi:hypothetical protein